MITYYLSNYEFDVSTDRKTLTFLAEEIASLLSFEEDGIAIDFDLIEMYRPFTSPEVEEQILIRPESLVFFLKHIIKKATPELVEEKLFLFSMTSRVEEVVNRIFQENKIAL